MGKANITNILSKPVLEVKLCTTIINGRYFSVTSNDIEEQSMDYLDSLIESAIYSAENRDQEYQRSLNQVQDNTLLVTKTPWLRRTRWEETFQGKDMEKLLKLAEPPEQGALDERALWDSTSRVIMNCFKGFLNCLERRWSLIPFWLASVDRNKEDTKPYRAYIAPETLRRYIGYWQQYLLFCVRARMTEDAVQFTAAQEDCLMEVIVLTNESILDSNALDAKVYQLTVLLIMHSDYAAQDSSLIYFSGVMGYNLEWKQWRQPQEYTTILAGLQFCIRMVMLEHALPSEQRDEFTEDSEVNPVAKFRTVRDIWLVDGEGTPFGYIHRLLNYGMAAAKNTTTRSRIRWSADARTLYFDGRALRLEDWIKFVEDLISLAEELLSTELLFRNDGTIPEVDLYTVDDSGNHEAGHYFALDEQDAWKKSRQRIMNSLKSSPFWDEVIEVEGDGLKFFKAGVDEYEARDTKFREYLALLMIFNPGLSGRGTEATSLKYINTMEGDRSIYLEDGQIMFITEYHKSMALMDEVKVCWAVYGLELTLDYPAISWI